MAPYVGPRKIVVRLESGVQSRLCQGELGEAGEARSQSSGLLILEFGPIV